MKQTVSSFAVLTVCVSHILAQSVHTGDVLLTNAAIAGNSGGYAIQAGVTNRGTAQAEFNLNYSFACGQGATGSQLANGEFLDAGKTKTLNNTQNLCAS